VDGAGIGSAMAANKVPGIRAATCHDAAAARNAREHNDANVLSLGAKFVDAARAAEVVETFLLSSCTEERHARRVGKITAIEAQYLK
jgi:ribose 5-phosphate isomerase B